jgi:hypothetical protein
MRVEQLERRIPASELALIVAGVIWRHPSRHDQEVYLDGGRFSAAPLAELAAVAGSDVPPGAATGRFCGTTGCVAGWTAVIGGDPRAVITRDDDEGWTLTLTVTLRSGTEIHVVRYARQLLGLTVTQADWLFEASRRRVDVIRALVLLAGHPGATAEELARAPHVGDAELDALPYPPAVLAGELRPDVTAAAEGDDAR